jgi:DNA mismatch endonuclease (patch repair protein)
MAGRSQTAGPKTQPFKQVEKRLNQSGRALRTTAAASRRMSSVRRDSTRPELHVRKILRSLGHRYTTSNRDLPGSPDLANRSRGWAVFVHGCYWHSHKGCPKATVPKRNRAFWMAKFRRNVERDRWARSELEALGYAVVVVWECEVENQMDSVRNRLAEHLPKPAPGLRRPVDR